MDALKYAVTGHQPPALGGFGAETDRRLRHLADRWVARMSPAEVISGMATGWDMAMAEAVVSAGVPLVAALAWPEQGANWPNDARARLERLLDCASYVHVAFRQREQGMWTVRDRWVLDRGDAVVALWSGAPGGTGEAVSYARSSGKPVENLWGEWEALSLTSAEPAP